MKIPTLLCLFGALTTSQQTPIDQARHNCSSIYAREIASCQQALGKSYLSDCKKSAMYKTNSCIKRSVNNEASKYR